jgi:hypothetical protein
MYKTQKTASLHSQIKSLYQVLIWKMLNQDNAAETITVSSSTRESITPMEGSISSVKVAKSKSVLGAQDP